MTFQAAGRTSHTQAAHSILAMQGKYVVYCLEYREQVGVGGDWEWGQASKDTPQGDAIICSSLSNARWKEAHPSIPISFLYPHFRQRDDRHSRFLCSKMKTRKNKQK